MTLTGGMLDMKQEHSWQVRDWIRAAVAVQVSKMKMKMMKIKICDVMWWIHGAELGKYICAP